MQVIYETDLDISHKLNNYELNVWQKHLSHIKKEIDTLQKMWLLEIDDELGDQFMIEQLNEVGNANDALMESLRNYIVTKSNDLLCEDFQCDLDILSEHERYRNQYLIYLKQYRGLKNNIYRMLKGKPLTTDNSQLKYG